MLLKKLENTAVTKLLQDFKNHNIWCCYKGLQILLLQKLLQDFENYNIWCYYKGLQILFLLATKLLQDFENHNIWRCYKGLQILLLQNYYRISGTKTFGAATKACKCCYYKNYYKFSSATNA